MAETLLAHETWIRLAAYAGILTLMAGLEMALPRRMLSLPRTTRWPSNLGVAALDIALVRLLFPMTAVAFAALCEANSVGLFNAYAVPGWAAVLLAVIALDFVIYAQHVLFHAVPVLWRLHRMHHADVDIDVTTGARFHPIEILMSMGIKLAAIAVLGAPAVAVLAFEVLLNATAMFNHSNVRLPEGLDRVLRLIVVTPDMHRVHHSVLRPETNSNYGFNLPWWDRMFGTYRAEPKAGHEGMTIGLDEFRDPEEERLDRLLTQPFRSDEIASKAAAREP